MLPSSWALCAPSLIVAYVQQTGFKGNEICVQHFRNYVNGDVPAFFWICSLCCSAVFKLYDTIRISNLAN